MEKKVSSSKTILTLSTVFAILTVTLPLSSNANQFGTIPFAEVDPCDQVLEQGCSPDVVQDPTGESEGGGQAPSFYAKAKKKSEGLLLRRLNEWSKSSEWKDAIEFVKAPPTAFRNKGLFQDPTLETQMLSACVVDPNSSNCVLAATALLVSEIQFNIFASTDIVYRKESFQHHKRNTLGAWVTYGGPMTKSQLDNVAIGTVISTQVLEKFENLFPNLGKIRKETIAELIPDLLPDSNDLQRVETIIPEVRSLLLSFISEQPNGSAAYHKLESVGFSAPDLESFQQSENFLSVLNANAFYSSSTNKFEYLPGMVLHNRSTFSQFFIVAHELAHSVDPCVFGRPEEGKFWLPKAISCLREQAKVADLTKLNPTTLSTSQFCGGDDQIGESTADFIAAEVFGRYLIQKWSSLNTKMRINAVSQVLRPFRCDVPAIDGDTHLPTQERYRRIILANPKVREFLSCRRSSPYTCP